MVICGCRYWDWWSIIRTKYIWLIVCTKSLTTLNNECGSRNKLRSVYEQNDQEVSKVLPIKQHYSFNILNGISTSSIVPLKWFHRNYQSKSDYFTYCCFIFQGGESDSARSSLARFASLPPEGSYDQGPKKMTCSRALLRTTDCMNTSVLDCSLTFTCDKNICVYGIQVRFTLRRRFFCYFHQCI